VPMELVLKIVSSEQHLLGDSASKSFFPVGGVIGRSKQCDWVIPDQSRHLSGCHAQISSEGETFFITDISTNGVYLNGSSEALGKNNPSALSSGDMLLMGDIQILAEVHVDSTRNGFSPSESADLGFANGEAVLDPRGSAGPILDPLEVLRQKMPGSSQITASGAGTVETLAAGSESNQLDSWHRESMSMPDGLSAIQETFSAPSMSSEKLPEDWNALGGEEVEPMAAPVLRPGNRARNNAVGIPNPPGPAIDPFRSPVSSAPQVDEPVKGAGLVIPSVEPRSPSVAPPSDEYLAAFCRGLGIDPSELGVDGVVLMQSAGEALRETFSGVVNVMKGRASLKNEFRMDMTLVQMDKNNPLKFAIDDKQVLKHFVSSEKEGFLNIPMAIKESFSDIQEHQIGVMAGAQASLSQLLDKVAPTRLEEKFNRTSAKGFSITGKKARYWDAYKEYHYDIQQEDSTFSAVFGDTFAVTYKDQIDRLKAAKTGEYSDDNVDLFSSVGAVES